MTLDKKLLIVDDDFNTLKLIELILRTYPIKVLTANNAEEGLKTYQEFKPDLVITEIRLPKISGLTFFEEIKKINSDQKVYFMNNDLAYNSIGLDLGADRFIRKPIDTRTLPKEIMDELY